MGPLLYRQSIELSQGEQNWKKLAIPVPPLFWRLLPVPHLFPCSSIDWTHQTLYCSQQTWELVVQTAPWKTCNFYRIFPKESLKCTIRFCSRLFTVFKVPDCPTRLTKSDNLCNSLGQPGKTVARYFPLAAPLGTWDSLSRLHPWLFHSLTQ